MFSEVASASITFEVTLTIDDLNLMKKRKSLRSFVCNLPSMLVLRCVVRWINLGFLVELDLSRLIRSRKQGKQLLWLHYLVTKLLGIPHTRLHYVPSSFHQLDQLFYKAGRLYIYKCLRKRNNRIHMKKKKKQNVKRDAADICTHKKKRATTRNCHNRPAH